jgi:hypothetical protein
MEGWRLSLVGDVPTRPTTRNGGEYVCPIGVCLISHTPIQLDSLLLV